MGPGRLIRVSKNGDKPQSVTYIVCETDAAKAMAIIFNGVGGGVLDDIQDLGRVSEELLKAMSIGPGQFVSVDGVRHVSANSSNRSRSPKSKHDGLMSEIADEYRRKAEACRRLADRSPEPNRKAHWIQQATDWERLAADALKQSRRKQRTEALTS
jgi:hypothetical protein